MEAKVAALVVDAGDGRLGRAVGNSRGPRGAHRHPMVVELRVAFDGEDMEEVAEQAGLSREQLIESILTADLTVAVPGLHTRLRVHHRSFGPPL